MQFNLFVQALVDSFRNATNVRSVIGRQCRQGYENPLEAVVIQRKNVSRRVIVMPIAILYHVQEQGTATCHSIALKKVILDGPDSERKHIKVCHSS